MLLLHVPVERRLVKEIHLALLARESIVPLTIKTRYQQSIVNHAQFELTGS